MKILEISPYGTGKTGGTELVCAHLSRGLAATEGMSVTWAASADTLPASFDRVKLLPMERLFSWLNRLGDWASILDIWTVRSLLLLRKAVLESDVVHIHDSKHIGCLLALYWAKKVGIPVVFTEHSAETHAPSWLSPFNPLRHAIRMHMLHRATEVVYVARHLQQSDEHDLKRATKVILCGVDPSVFHFETPDKERARRLSLEWDPERPTLLYVGRFGGQKRIGVLRALAASNPQWLFVLVGSGKKSPERWELPNVMTMPKTEHATLSLYYHCSDLLLLPSYGEGISLVTLEALACGLPVVISKIAHPQNHLPDGTFAVVDDEGTDERAAAAWSSALSKLLQPGVLKKFHDTVRKRPTGLTWDHMAAEYLALYRSITEAR